MDVKLRKAIKNQKGQAVIETALALPLLIWLLFYTLNSFNMVHTTHIAQRYTQMGLYQRLQNRAKFSVDSFGPGTTARRTEHNRDFMAVQYTNADGNRPNRSILGTLNNGVTASPGTSIRTVVGICKEPGCN